MLIQCSDEFRISRGLLPNKRQTDTYLMLQPMINFLVEKIRHLLAAATNMRARRIRLRDITILCISQNTGAIIKLSDYNELL